MKITDFSPRTAALEFYLSGQNLTGVEVGCNVGAHAESLLTHCSITKLHLIDTFENVWTEGYCEGRLARWFHKIKIYKGFSNEVVKQFLDISLDFVYLDAMHDYVSVREDLNLWWPKLKYQGILALRNYNKGNEGLYRAANEFLNGKTFKIEDYHNEIIIWK